MGISDIFKASKIKEENDKLKEVFDEIGANDIIKVKERIESLKKEEEALIKKKHSILDEISQVESDLQVKKKQNQDEITKLNGVLFQKKKDIEKDIRVAESELIEKRNQILSVEEQLMFESFALYTPHYSFQNSETYKQKLDNVRDRQKDFIKSGLAASGNQNWTVNGSLSEGKKMVNDTIKLVIRCFNNECDYCIDNVKFNNVDKAEKRIIASFDALNKLGRITSVSISNDYKKFKLEELYLAYEYQQKKQEEKEEQRRLKEEMREQMKLEQEIKVARERILKEKKHYSKAIKDVEERLNKVTSESEKDELIQKLEDLKKKSEILDEEEKVIDYREQNAKAGYVYVISNIGSFGENVYKIGMTRRLDPTDRVYELGDASVPFPFDIHAMVFSENAPELERKLQSHFRKGQLNKINDRKEFFHANINEIESIIKENYDSMIEIVKNPPAEQYRESILIKA